MSVTSADGARIDVRRARFDDAAAIAQLTAQLGYPTLSEAITRRLDVLLSSAEHGVLVASDEARLVGWLHVVVTRALEYEPCAEILGLVVDEAKRGLGAGAALVAAAEIWARERGMSEMRVRSRVTREGAHRFYERQGYVEWKRQVAFRKTLGS